MHEGREQAPLRAVAQAHQNNGQHAHKGDRAAVRQLVNGNVAEHGAKRDHQCAFHKGACLCVCFCRHGKYPFQNGVTQKQNVRRVAQNHTAHAELCCFMQKLPTPALPGSGKKGLWPRVRQPNLSLSAPPFLCPFPIIRAARALSRKMRPCRCAASAEGAAHRHGETKNHR